MRNPIELQRIKKHCIQNAPNFTRDKFGISPISLLSFIDIPIECSLKWRVRLRNIKCSGNINNI